MARSPVSRSPSRSRSRSVEGKDKKSKRRERTRSPEEKRKRRERTFSPRARSRSPQASNRLHIANLDESVTKRHVEEAFSKYGKLEDIWVASYPPLYSFVVFENIEDATTALKEMRSGYIKECHIRTSVALPRNSGRRDRGPPQRRHFGRSRSPEFRRRRYSPDHRRERRRSRSPERRRRSRS